MSDERVIAICFYANGAWHSIDDDSDPVNVRQEALGRVARAAQAYLDHTEDQDYRRGHTNTSCPPLTRAMCKQYMQLRAELARLNQGVE